MRNEIISKLNKDYLHNLILDEMRVDGRKFKEIRDIKIETGVIGNAEGSAKITLGDTQLIVGIKLQIGSPFPDSLDKGIIITNMELNPIASPEFESGPPRENAIEMSRVVDRGIRESKAIDLNKLCILEGEEVWIVFIDIHVLNNGGNLIDAATLGAITALMTAKLPLEREGRGTDTFMPIREIPISITFARINGELIIDPTEKEESVCDVKLTIISNQDGSISAMQKSGGGSIKIDKILEAVEIAGEKSSEIREKYLKNI